MIFQKVINEIDKNIDLSKMKINSKGDENKDLSEIFEII